MTRAKIALFVSLAIAAGGWIPGSNAASTPFRGDAKALLPTAAALGASIAKESADPITGKASPAILSSWQSEYAAAPLYSIVGVVVYRTDADATAAYAKVCRADCFTLAAPRGWTYRRKDYRAQGRSSATLIASCGNVLVAASTSGPDDALPTFYAPVARGAIDSAIARAVAAGMTPCWTSAPPRLPTPKAYLSESAAEAVVSAKVRIPWCLVWPDDVKCAKFRGYEPTSVSCRGSDELAATFTYYRFTCDYEAGRERLVKGKVAVWVVGPGRIRWALI